VLARRSILRVLGLGSVVSPLAVKAAADKTIADLSGIAAHNPPSPGIGLSGGMPQTSDSISWKSKVLRWLATRSLPDWFEDEMRLRNRHIGYLDPDIAAKRSWSMAVKVLTQRERNIERAKHDAIEGPRRGLRSREFEEQFGIWL
jgi:hypothetical protein